MSAAQTIKISIHALGGQGGGVLANWLVALGESAGYIAQSTSVPGVAQRTGATVYYVELFPEAVAQAQGKLPVLGLMPAPGDVNIVMASEIMEAGRAHSRGLISSHTTLIASTHRVYSIGEKIAMGDARINEMAVVNAVEEAAGHSVLSDMDEMAEKSGSMISAVLFGALAGAGALPISRDKFEATITASGRTVAENLSGFNAGFMAAQEECDPQELNDQKRDQGLRMGQPSRAASELLSRVEIFPATAHFMITEGLKKVVDYQDIAYGGLYLDRLAEILDLDRGHGGARRDWALLRAVAKHLALWMAYEDAIRVADLKTRSSRFKRFREDVNAKPGQIVQVSEFMHPRVEEVCDILPRWMALSISGSKTLSAILKKMLGGGRRVSTTKLRGFLMLNMLGSFRRFRRSSYRFGVEQARIEDWLKRVTVSLDAEYQLACEMAGLQRLLKGYGDTFERGLGNYRRISEVVEQVKLLPDSAKTLRRLREAALEAEDGITLARELAMLGVQDIQTLGEEA